MHGHWVHVDAGHGGSQPVRVSMGSRRVRAAAAMKWVTASAMKVPAAGRVEHVPIKRVRHHFPHHRARQPVGGVVLTQLAPLVGRDDALIQDGGDVGGRFAPVEPGDAIRHGFDQRQPADLQRPGEEVRLHDSL